MVPRNWCMYSVGSRAKVSSRTHMPHIRNRKVQLLCDPGLRARSLRNVRSKRPHLFLEHIHLATCTVM